MSTLHIIRRQTMHLKVHGSQQLALGLQQRVSRLCHEQLSTMITQTLDAHASPEQYLYIDQLKLDLGSIPSDQLEQQLALRLQAALRQSLSAQRYSDQPSTEHSDTDTSKSYSPWQYQITAFVYFLEQGYLPWWYSLPGGQTLEQAILAQHTQAEPTHIQQQARQLVLPTLRHSQARKRLSKQFSAAFQSQCLLWLGVPNAQHTDTAFLDSTKYLSDALTPELLSDLFWQPLWDDLNQGQSITLEAHWERLWKQLPLALREEQAVQAIQQQFFPAQGTASANLKAEAEIPSSDSQVFISPPHSRERDAQSDQATRQRGSSRDLYRQCRPGLTASVLATVVQQLRDRH